MASLISHLLFFPLLLLLLTSPSTASAASFRPKALLLQVSKDSSTHQYTTTLNQRTPLVPVPVTLDLGAQFLWVDCDRAYASSTYRPARCNSAQCSLANSKSCGTCNAPARPGCNNNTCGLFPENPFTNTATGGELASDVVQIRSTDGSNPGLSVTVPNFLFVCGPTFLLKGLAQGVQGIAGLGRTRISLPAQFSAAFSFPRKFAICLPSTPRGNGVVFFGDGPYKFLLNTDASTGLTYTRLLINPVSTAATSFAGEPSAEYFIGVKSIKIRDTVVPLNTTLLTIDSNGNGGTKISTVVPYTVLETSIFKALTETFINVIKDVPRVKAVAPFKVCYKASSFPSTRVGLGVPQIDLVVDGGALWTIFGANSMVEVADNVVCLGFVDGGANPRTAIVIGGYQLEDNLVQFDLARSRVGRNGDTLMKEEGWIIGGK
ncbi:hypothetical protein Cgig2_016587 [Carnegiea gigantea]|uniref:Peptidase A1 domain-containing protein n=1 Tax=Carnegiea gigantea TaxID=171969 RepID=A0A9Q1KW71_9CARY|nr:hypothetical protein Cgig2_016587 [Carnegiea gigantea]